MPLSDIPLEAFGHVFKALGNPAEQARLRAAHSEMVRAFNLAVLNEQFIDMAGSMDTTDTLTNYDVRWLPVNWANATRNAGAVELVTFALSSSVSFTPPPSVGRFRAPGEHVIVLQRPTDAPFRQRRPVLDWPLAGTAKARRVTLVGLTSLPNGFLAGCPSLTSVDFIGSTVTELGEYVLQAGALQAVVLPDSITSAGRGCLRDCRSLTSVHIPAGLQRLSDGFLSQCPSLTSVDFTGSTLTELSERFLEGADALQAIVLLPQLDFRAHPSGTTALARWVLEALPFVDVDRLHRLRVD